MAVIPRISVRKPQEKRDKEGLVEQMQMSTQNPKKMKKKTWRTKGQRTMFHLCTFDLQQQELRKM